MKIIAHKENIVNNDVLRRYWRTPLIFSVSHAGLSRQYQTPAYPGLYGAAYNYPGPGGGGMAGMFPSYPGSGPAPSLNMNTMHVSLSAPAPGLSLTIETGGGSGSGGGGGLVSPRPVFTKQEADAGSPGSGPAPALAPWHTAVADTKKRPARHHQQSRTIFRCVSGEGGEAARDCDSRSTISSQMSDYSPGPGLAASLDTQMRPNLTFNSRPEFGAFSPNDAHQEVSTSCYSQYLMCLTIASFFLCLFNIFLHPNQHKQIQEKY